MLNIMQHIGAKIRLYRLAKHWTQEQLADCIGSTGTYIGRLERGEKNVRIQTLVKIAEALDISIFALLENDNEEYLYQKKWVWDSLTLMLQQSDAKQKMIYHVIHAIVNEENN
ncbi:helix-turn-helix transcriptional regulator [Paenibacillus macerans]|uniref:helix-turn-helix domain-containing protein n=1 Tax=Paenibacillus macerans TaxID=44252 RepID=UPI001F1040C3|nr:helix-turn-helix transcriptional regulator [Paenibacillus macerans]MBS5914366.1 helix-turn-helix transcriptional regulator [Paenibacillus macerans]MEC0141344.1 helix-turn-helix transcriptional regulator [Paenibacillus macerans]UMV45317.1 helix-turn-helix domain-containing protein [Paenibacillus macerans]